MDLMQKVWDKLRENGHILGDSYIQETGGQMIVVDGVAMSLPEAAAVAEKRMTIAEIALSRGPAHKDFQAVCPNGHVCLVQFNRAFVRHDPEHVREGKRKCDQCGVDFRMPLQLQESILAWANSN